MLDETCLEEIFQFLSEKIDPIKNNTPKRKLPDIRNILVSREAGYWERGALYLSLILSSLFSIFALVIVVFKIHLPIDLKINISVTVYIIIAILYVINVTANFQRNSKSSKGFIRKQIATIGITDREEQETINQLYRIASNLENLKEADLRFKPFIDKSKARSQNTSNFLPLLAIILSIIFAYLITQAPQTLKNLLSGGVQSAPALSAVAVSVLKLIIESELNLRNANYEKYLSLIKRAQLKWENTTN